MPDTIAKKRNLSTCWAIDAGRGAPFSRSGVPHPEASWERAGGAVVARARIFANDTARRRTPMTRKSGYGRVSAWHLLTMALRLAQYLQRNAAVVSARPASHLLVLPWSNPNVRTKCSKASGTGTRQKKRRMHTKDTMTMAAAPSHETAPLDRQAMYKLLNLRDFSEEEIDASFASMWTPRRPWRGSARRTNLFNIVPVFR